MGKGVQQQPIPDPLGQLVRSGQRTDWPDAGDGRWRVSSSRIWKPRVRWRVFSQKPEETRPNRWKSNFRWNFLDSTRSQPFLARSQLDPWNLHRIWWDLAKSGEILPSPAITQWKSSENIIDFLPILPLTGRILADFEISNSDRSDRHPLKVRSTRSN